MLSDYFSEINDHGTVVPVKDLAAFPRSEQAVLGAKNLLTWWKRYKTGYNIEFTVNNDDTVTVVVGTDGASATLELLADDGMPQDYMFLAEDLRKNPCILSNTGFYDSNVFVEVVYRTSENTFISDERLTNVAEKRLTIPANAYYARFAIYVKNGTSAGTYTLKPMLRLASDPDSTYIPHAMTNKALTEKVTLIDDATKITFAEGVALYGATYFSFNNVGDLNVISGLINGVVANADTWATIGSIASGFRPKRTYFGFAGIVSTNEVVELQLYSDGDIVVRRNGSAIVATNNIRIFAVYAS